MAGKLTDAEVTAMRTHLTATLPDTCEIDYVTRTADGVGGYTEAWTARGTAIACRLSPANQGREAQITGAQVREAQVWVLSVAYDQTVTVQDRVVVGGKTYRVTQVNEGESEIGLVRCYMELAE